jgi:hypothetical protein
MFLYIVHAASSDVPVTGMSRLLRKAAEPLATELDSMIPKTWSMSTRARAALRFPLVLDSSSRQLYTTFRPCTPPVSFARPSRASMPARKGRKSEAAFPLSG